MRTRIGPARSGPSFRTPSSQSIQTPRCTTAGGPPCRLLASRGGGAGLRLHGRLDDHAVARAGAGAQRAAHGHRRQRRHAGLCRPPRHYRRRTGRRPPLRQRRQRHAVGRRRQRLVRRRARLRRPHRRRPGHGHGRLLHPALRHHRRFEHRHRPGRRRGRRAHRGRAGGRHELRRHLRQQRRCELFLGQWRHRHRELCRLAARRRGQSRRRQCADRRARPAGLGRRRVRPLHEHRERHRLALCGSTLGRRRRQHTRRRRRRRHPRRARRQRYPHRRRGK